MDKAFMRWGEEEVYRFSQFLRFPMNRKDVPCALSRAACGMKSN